MNNLNNVNDFFNTMDTSAKLLSSKVYENRENNKDEFDLLANKMLNWSKTFLGDSCMEKLVYGYRSFVADVNRSQMRYEKTEKYENSNYEEVYKDVYSNSAFMTNYFWGVYVTTFAWEHHLKLNTFFKDHFLNRILDSDSDSKIIDLGSGSGIWSMLTASECLSVNAVGVDISETSVEMAKEFSRVNGFEDRISFVVSDATTYKTEKLNDFGISCFLIEHLENPLSLLKNLNANLNQKGIAFVTAALTAAEIDHIYEIKKESELIKLAEDAGFRVLSSFSAAPSRYPAKMKFLPRSMAMVLQKKDGDIW